VQVDEDWPGQSTTASSSWSGLCEAMCGAFAMGGSWFRGNGARYRANSELWNPGFGPVYQNASINRSEIRCRLTCINISRLLS
jgi:hypothetical protein